MEMLKAKWKFFALIALGLGITAGMTTWILTHRVDAGFMVQDCIPNSGNKGTLRWAKQNIPVQVRLEQGEEDWKLPLENAVNFWNKQAGFDLFFIGPILHPLEEPLAPVVTFEVVSDGSFDEDHPGKTSHDRTASCEIQIAHVHVNGLVTDAKLRDAIARHELGHALGLDHDSYESSVMYTGGKAMGWGMDKITKKDKKLLKETYQQ